MKNNRKPNHQLDAIAEQIYNSLIEEVERQLNSERDCLDIDFDFDLGGNILVLGELSLDGQWESYGDGYNTPREENFVCHCINIEIDQIEEYNSEIEDFEILSHHDTQYINAIVEDYLKDYIK